MNLVCYLIYFFKIPVSSFYRQGNWGSREFSFQWQNTFHENNYIILLPKGKKKKQASQFIFKKRNLKQLAKYFQIVKDLKNLPPTDIS